MPIKRQLRDRVEALERKAAAVEPFRIFSGWDQRQAEEADVFAFSVKEHASIPVRIEGVSIHSGAIWTMDLARKPELSGGNGLASASRTGVTSFSYARFYVPWICGYEGVAVYADGCDQLCLGDVAELAAIPMDDHAVLVTKHKFHDQRRPRSWTSLMLIDCSKLRCWSPEAVETASDTELMRFGAFPDEVIGELPWEWNALQEPDVEPSPDVRIAHWSYLSEPDGGSWIDRSGSQVWAAARERWRAA
jgi:hypothetical protein